MPRKPVLRSVGPNDAPPPAAPKRPLTIESAAAAGDRLDELKAMRLRLARAMDDPGTPARDLSSLSRRQIEIGREIESIEKAVEEEARERDATPDENWDVSAI